MAVGGHRRWWGLQAMPITERVKNEEDQVNAQQTSARKGWVTLPVPRIPSTRETSGFMPRTMHCTHPFGIEGWGGTRYASRLLIPTTLGLFAECEQGRVAQKL